MIMAEILQKLQYFNPFNSILNISSYVVKSRLLYRHERWFFRLILDKEEPTLHPNIDPIFMIIGDRIRKLEGDFYSLSSS